VAPPGCKNIWSAGGRLQDIIHTSPHISRIIAGFKITVLCGVCWMGNGFVLMMESYLIFNVIFYSLYGPHKTSLAKEALTSWRRRRYLIPEGGIASVVVKNFSKGGPRWPAKYFFKTLLKQK
jgi:hypothetical protein